MFDTLRNLLESGALLGVVGSVAIAASACGPSEARECTKTEECFMGQYCSADKICVDGEPPVTVNNSTSSNNTTPGNNTSPNNTSSNNTTSGNNTTPGNSMMSGNSSTGNSTTGNSSSGNSSTGNSNASTSECRFDLLNAPTCAQKEDESEPNDTNKDSQTLNQRGGCYQGYDSEYKGVGHALSRQLCAYEEADWFRFELGSCETRSFVATIELVPEQACTHEETRLIIEQGGLDRISIFDSNMGTAQCDADPMMDCMPLENGGWRVRLSMPSIQSGDARDQSSYFYAGVDGQPYAQFGYTLNISVPELQ